MKKIIYFLLILPLLAAMSCESIFEITPDGRLSNEEIFSDYMLTGAYLNKAYSYMPTLATSYPNSNPLSVFTDEAHDSKDVDGGNTANYYVYGMTKQSNPIDNNLYNQMYEGIRYCNIFIDNIDDATNMNVESDRSKWRGEAHLLRAFYYLQLIKHYGPVPIIQHELPMDYDYSKVVRPTFYDNVKSILKDCNKALAEESLPWRSSMDTERGSMTKSTAWAIKSQAILFAASPLWCGSQNHWEEAASVTRQAMEELRNQGFELYDPASSTIPAYNNYQRYFLVEPEMASNPSVDRETIYAAKGRLNIWQQHGVPVIPEVVKAGASPSQELVDAYETIDGKPVLDPSTPYSDPDHTTPNYNPDNKLYNPARPYENRDPRLKATIYCNGDNYNLKNNNTPVWSYQGGSSGIDKTDTKRTRTGYYLRKFAHCQSRKATNLDGYWRYFRFAEILLNFAEAEFYANNKVVTQDVIDAVNEVRNRAGMPRLSYGITSDEFVQRLRNERRVEFAFEEHRYFDLRRWKIQGQHEGVVTGMNIENKGINPDERNFTYKRILVSRRPVTDTKYLMWPIPFSEQGKFGMHGVNFQNPGW